MSIARIDPISALQHIANHQLAHAFQTLRVRVIEARRQRHEQRLMLLAVRQLDHPGVLADAQAASDPPNRR